MRNLAKLSCLLLAASVLGGPAASAEELAGAPMGYGPAPDEAQPAGHHALRHRGGECYAQVRYPAPYAPPPSGPEYVWTQAPAPPGAPGPVWCLTLTHFSGRPVQVAPERLGWIRVLCADDVTPERVEHLQRRLHERGLYRGEIDGRYDEQTEEGVVAFQRERRIAHRGYLSYETVSALEEGPSPCCAAAPPPPCCAPVVAAPCCVPVAPPPRVIYWRRPTTFERGYVSWPGKSAYW